MHAIPHRLDHLPEDLLVVLRRALLSMFSGFGASWDRLMERSAARAADDMLWDDGEPGEPADKS